MHFDLMVISLQKIWPCAERNLTAENSGVDRPEMRTPEVTDGLQEIIESENPSAEKGIQAHSVIEKKDNQITKIGTPTFQKENHSLRIEKILTQEEKEELPIILEIEDKAITAQVVDVVLGKTTGMIDLVSTAGLLVPTLETEVIDLVLTADRLVKEVETAGLTDPVLRTDQNATIPEVEMPQEVKDLVLKETTGLVVATHLAKDLNKVLDRMITGLQGLGNRMLDTKTSLFQKPILRKFALTNTSPIAVYVPGEKRIL